MDRTYCLTNQWFFRWPRIRIIWGGTSRGFLDTALARIIRIEAAARERVTAVEARVAEDWQTKLAAQEIGEVAEESGRAGEAGRNMAAEKAAQVEERLGDRELSGPRG